MNSRETNAEIQQLLSLPSVEVNRWLSRRRDRGESILGVLCKRLRNRTLASDEQRRIAAVNVLIMALPHSTRCIQSLLRDFSRPHLVEVQFTLFVLLGWRKPPRDQACRRRLRLEARRYLMFARPRSRQAALLAADFLLRWDMPTGIRMVLAVARHGPTVSGRSVARSELEYILKSDLDERTRNLLMRALSPLTDARPRSNRR